MCCETTDPDHSISRKGSSFVKTRCWQSLREQIIPDGRNILSILRGQVEVGGGMQAKTA